MTSLGFTRIVDHDIVQFTPPSLPPLVALVIQSTILHLSARILASL